MREAVLEIIGYVETGTAGRLLSPCVARIGQPEVRRHCIKLMSWWGRTNLIRSRHPYLDTSPASPWVIPFREFVASIPELDEILSFDGSVCRFAIDVSEQGAINSYVMENCRPPLFR